MYINKFLLYTIWPYHMLQIDWGWIRFWTYSICFPHMWSTCDQDMFPYTEYHLPLIYHFYHAWLQDMAWNFYLNDIFDTHYHINERISVKDHIIMVNNKEIVKWVSLKQFISWFEFSNEVTEQFFNIPPHELPQNSCAGVYSCNFLWQGSQKQRDYPPGFRWVFVRLLL